MTNPDPRYQVWDRPADRLRSSAEASYDRFRNNASLTQDARTAYIAAQYLQTVEAMTQLQGSTQAGAATDLAALRRAAYGIDDILQSASQADKATIAISFRDAQDRAAQLADDRSAAALLDTAMNSGDELLVRAVGNAAVTPGFAGVTWPDTASAYLAARPAKAAALSKLQDAETQTLTASVAFEFVVPQPSELSSLSDGQISQLAAQAASYRAGA